MHLIRFFRLRKIGFTRAMVSIYQIVQNGPKSIKESNLDAIALRCYYGQWFGSIHWLGYP
ncbi:MAG: hypothetical protein WCA79_05765, partial [Anaerolineales bacterium]